MVVFQAVKSHPVGLPQPTPYFARGCAGFLRQPSALVAQEKVEDGFHNQIAGKRDIDRLRSALGKMSRFRHRG